MLWHQSASHHSSRSPNPGRMTDQDLCTSRSAPEHLMTITSQPIWQSRNKPPCDFVNQPLNKGASSVGPITRIPDRDGVIVKNSTHAQNRTVLQTILRSEITRKVTLRTALSKSPMQTSTGIQIRSLQASCCFHYTPQPHILLGSNFKLCLW